MFIDYHSFASSGVKIYGAGYCKGKVGSNADINYLGLCIISRTSRH